MKVILLGTTQGCVRTMFEGTINKARAFAKANNLKFWAIYRPFFQGRPFHNATDKDYLIEHYNDPYWLNREDAERCTHPPARIYSWFAADGTLCAGCCDCGAVLAGGV